MYYTKHHTGYEIWSHEFGTITFFESYVNVENLAEDNSKNPKGYTDYGIRLVVTIETDLHYHWSK